MSSRIAAAKAIRKDLKNAFPNVTFSIRSSGRVSDSVTISWTDGPCSNEIRNLLKKYELGAFIGNDDSYHYSNKRNDVPQVEYIFTNREYSEYQYHLDHKGCK